MSSSKKLATQLTPELAKSHALMKRRNEDALKAVEEMSKHPYSREQKIKQRDEMRRRAGLPPLGTNTSKP